MAKVGAKGKYDTLVKPFLKEINDKIRLGVTEEQIAKALGISVASLNNYRRQHKEFAEALSKNKGADVLTELLNAGIESAIGGFKENVVTVVETDKDGNTVTKTTTTKFYYPPNASLNKFYVMNYGKKQGFTNDPLSYELQKDKQEFQKATEKKKNWDIDLENYK